MKKSQFISLAILLVIVTILLIAGAFDKGDGDPIISKPTSTPKSSSVALLTPTPDNSEATPEPTPTPTPVRTPVVFPTVDKGYISTLGTKASTWYSSVKTEADGLVYPVFNKDLDQFLEGIKYVFTKPVAGQKTFYLTFNEGWDDADLKTKTILDILKEKNVKATFYLTYEYMKVEANQAIIKRMVNEGHELGTRGYAGKPINGLSVDDAIKQLLEMEALLQEILGDNTVRMNSYRFIEKFSQRDLGIANQLGYTVSLWSYNYNDYVELDAAAEQKAFNQMIDNIYDGSVFCLSATSKTNVKYLPDLIDEIKAQGYVFDVIKNK